MKHWCSSTNLLWVEYPKPWGRVVENLCAQCHMPHIGGPACAYCGVKFHTGHHCHEYRDTFIVMMTWVKRPAPPRMGQMALPLNLA